MNAQWVEHHAALGVSKIYIWDNKSRKPMNTTLMCGHLCDADWGSRVYCKGMYRLLLGQYTTHRAAADYSNSGVKR